MGYDCGDRSWVLTTMKWSVTVMCRRSLEGGGLEKRDDDGWRWMKGVDASGGSRRRGKIERGGMVGATRGDCLGDKNGEGKEEKFLGLVVEKGERSLKSSC
ncbi:hypothetical protein GOBAR_DD06311 [Gossypium barbadense]|nr:hypothetical protein GOBAR_DD06311 [Gossypium barbadense]